MHSGRIIVIGDIHGDIHQIGNILFSLKLFDNDLNWIAEPANTIVVQMGDQIDSFRGTPNDWEVIPDLEVMRFMDKMDERAKEKGGRVISMCGNHELMNVMGDFSYVSPKSMEMSGGPANRHALFSNGNEFSNRLMTRLPILKIGRILFAHAGILPHHIQIINGDFNAIYELFRKFLKKEPLSQEEQHKSLRLFVQPDSLLWTRYYTESNELEVQDAVNKVLEMTGCTTICIGHTVHPEIHSKFEGKVWFVDNGISRSFFRGKPIDSLEIWHGGIANDANQHMPFRIHRLNVGEN